MLEINSEYVKNLRKKFSISQEELAEYLSVGVRTIQNWEGGKAIPKTKHEALSLLNASDEIIFRKDRQSKAVGKKERILKVIETYNKPLSTIAEQLGMELSDLEAELAQENVSSEFVIEFCTSLGVNIEWIFTGDGFMWSSGLKGYDIHENLTDQFYKTITEFDAIIKKMEAALDSPDFPEAKRKDVEKWISTNKQKMRENKDVMKNVGKKSIITESGEEINLYKDYLEVEQIDGGASLVDIGKFQVIALLPYVTLSQQEFYKSEYKVKSYIQKLPKIAYTIYDSNILRLGKVHYRAFQANDNFTLPNNNGLIQIDDILICFSVKVSILTSNFADRVFVVVSRNKIEMLKLASYKKTEKNFSFINNKDEEIQMHQSEICEMYLLSDYIRAVSY